MKTRKLIASEVVDGKKVVLGIDENHSVCETKEDCIELINAGTLTVGDCNSGFSVRRQRELRGAETKQEKLDKLAQEEGFVDWTDMTNALAEWKAAKQSE